MPVAAAGEDWKTNSIDIERINIELGEEHATVSVDYQMHGVMLLYVFILGGKMIEPALNTLIVNGDKVEITSITREHAKFNVTLNSSASTIRFSQRVPHVTIKYPDQRRFTFSNTQAIPLVL
ncbi:hypothetical protein DRN98_02380 [Methanosarcinales archaeon]|uniref:Uncharacterized protein n=1 Tax=Candidatus Syntropharchaeum caldarium TaxID=1838285 RepID=A0A1F2PAT7_9EURY|nr:MAG: hypothetical protein SCAL_001121 [Candidatus Syntrophoarchaeum caldarius]RLG34565.1 MAG: hypothetical protein DRN98_02380 [Methanosarcinales archaeon]